MSVHEGTPNSTTPTDEQREVVREREIIVTSNGNAPEPRRGGAGLVVGLVALLVVIVLGVFAVQAITTAAEDTDLEIPTEFDVNVNAPDSGGDGGAEAEQPQN